jgi:hypothetical protein
MNTDKNNNQILEESLLLNFRLKKAKRMAESFKRAENELEIVKMEEEEIGDSNEQFSFLNYEQLQKN